MTKLFLIIFLWNLDDTITHNIVIVDECPPTEFIKSQFDPLEKAGAIKTWAGYCKSVDFNPSETFKEKPKKETEEINA